MLFKSILSVLKINLSHWFEDMTSVVASLGVHEFSHRPYGPEVHLQCYSSALKMGLSALELALHCRQLAAFFRYIQVLLLPLED